MIAIEECPNSFEIAVIEIFLWSKYEPNEDLRVCKCIVSPKFALRTDFLNCLLTQLTE